MIESSNSKLKKINDLEAIELYNKGWSDVRCSKYFNCSYRAFNRWRLIRKLPVKNIKLRKINDIEGYIKKEKKRKLKAYSLYYPIKGKIRKKEYRNENKIYINLWHKNYRLKKKLEAMDK
jgi:hypothetical protein